MGRRAEVSAHVGADAAAGVFTPHGVGGAAVEVVCQRRDRQRGRCDPLGYRPAAARPAADGPPAPRRLAGCFNPDGTHTPGRCAWQRSNTAKQSALRVAELHRKAASAGGDRLYEFNPNTAALST